MFASHLRLRIWSEPREGARVSQLGQFLIDLVGQDDSQGHAFVGFVRRVAKHESLVTGADIFFVALFVNTWEVYEKG